MLCPRSSYSMSYRHLCILLFTLLINYKQQNLSTWACSGLDPNRRKQYVLRVTKKYLFTYQLMWPLPRRVRLELVILRLVWCDVWNVSWISWYKGLYSPGLCSEISSMGCWSVWICSCSYGSSIELLLICFSRDDGHKRCPKHVQFRDKINFGYLMHLVGYLYEAYHGARSLEHKVYKCIFILC
jgi:hypothetical protein